MHKDYRSIVITNKSTHSTSSSKSVNKRKRYKRTTRKQINTRHLIVTPASKLIFNISKRSREECDSLYNTKRRRLEAGTFQIEPIDEVDDLCLKELFCTDTYMRHHTVNMKLPDQNENLLSAPDELSEYKKRVCGVVKTNSIDFKSNTESSVTTNVNTLKDCKNVELKLQRISSPIDVKFDTTNNSTKLHDSKAATLNGIQIQYAKTKVEVLDLDRSHSKLWKDPIDIKDVKPAVVVKKESDIDIEIKVDRSYEPPSTTYPGQLLWAHYQKYPYWPAIVCVPDVDAPKGKSKRTWTWTVRGFTVNFKW